MDAMAERTGRRYHLVEYHGDPDAERVIVAMGSGAETAAETAAHLAARGEKVGVVQLRLYRPFPAEALLAAIPASARRVAVLDRTKEPGSLGEPLFLDVLGALAEAHGAGDPGDHADGHRRPLRALVEGVHPRDGGRGLRRAQPRSAATPFHRRHQRRRLRDQPRRTTGAWTSSRRGPSEPSSSGSARTGPSAPTRTPSRSSARTRAATPRGTSSTTRRNRARRRSLTSASGRTRSGPRT